MNTHRFSPETVLSRIFAEDAVRSIAEIKRFCALAGVDGETYTAVEKELVPLNEENMYTASHVVLYEKEIEKCCSILTLESEYSSADSDMPTAVDADIADSVCMDFIAHSKEHDDAEARAKVHAGLMRSRSRLLVLEGAPGTAKSTTAIELMKAYGEHRKRYTDGSVCDYKGLWVLAVNPLAMEKWRERAGVQGAIIDQILTTDEMGVATIPEGAFVIVDEAGLIGTEKTALLLKKAVECKWQKIILMGDVKQDSPNEYGQPLDYILRKFRNISFVMKTPFRQKNEDERIFVKYLYEGNSKAALEYLDERRRIFFENRKKIISSVSQSFAFWRKSGKNISKQCFILAASLKDVNDITEAVMNFQRSENIVTDYYPYMCASREFMIGKGDRVILQQTLSFTSEDDGCIKEYGRGTMGTVTASDAETITFRPDRKDNSAQNIIIRRDMPFIISPAYCLLFSQAQGIAADISFVVITDRINGTSMISACSRHRYRCDVFVDSDIYPSFEELEKDVGTFNVKRMPYLDGDIKLQEEHK